jgi:hypothetical protein
MTLHRKDFVSLAKILNKHRSRISELENPVLDDIWDQFFSETLKWLESSNEQFDRVRFIHAVEEEDRS